MTGLCYGDGLLRFVALQARVAAVVVAGGAVPADVPPALAVARTHFRLPLPVITALATDAVTGIAALRHFALKFVASAFFGVDFGDVQLAFGANPLPVTIPAIIASLATLGKTAQVKSAVWLGVAASRGESTSGERRGGRSRKRGKASRPQGRQARAASARPPTPSPTP